MQTLTRRDGAVKASMLGGIVLGATAACVSSPASSTPATGAGGGVQPSVAAAAAAAGAPTTATAELRDRTGKTVGTARLTGESDGAIHLVVHVDGMTPGNHGIHFHAVGSCVPGDSTAFVAAGPHHNPTGKKHGLENPDGPHAGDLPNITVGANGSGDLDTRTPRATLGAGATSLLDADGSALVVHAGADDQRTDPSGNSGARVACGVVTAG